MDLPENELRGYIQDKGKPMWTAHNNHNIRYFKEEEIRIITSNYNTLLGKGSFGEVYKGVLDDSSSVAVKRYIHNVKESFAKEVIVHCQINHRNVVRLIGCCIGENALMVVTEYISNGNLSDILHCSEISISLETRLDISIGCAEALSYMHSQMYGKVIHGDIKPANILLDEKLNTKISDFGISKLLSTDNTLYTTHVLGSIGYMDPLFARSGRLTSKSDVYSFGVVLLELITRRKAVDDGKISLIENFTQAVAKRKKLREFYDVKVADDNNLRILDGVGKLAAECLEMDIEKRPEMKDVAGRLRMLRKAQYQSQEKVGLFGWVWRSKQPPQNWTEGEAKPRIMDVPNGIQGEHVAAEWPRWLTEAVAEAIHGWQPRRAESFEKLDKIGQGEYSSVYKGRDLENGKIVALKKVRFNIDPESVQFIAREIHILRRLDHPNVVKLEGLVTSQTSKSLYLVFEYMEQDLEGLAATGLKFTEPQVKCYMKQLLSGLDHCHNRGVLHRDIKGANLLLDNNGILKIAGFGLAKFFNTNQKQYLTRRVVTLWYQSPELLLGATNYGAAVDLWSAGCILAELLSGKPIMPGRSVVEQLDNIFKLCGSPPEEFWKSYRATIFKPKHSYRRCVNDVYKDFPTTALALLDHLLAVEPGNRGTAASALDSEFLTIKPACDSSSLPKYPPSQEYDAKLGDEEARQIEAAKGQETGAGRRKELPAAPHGNGGLQVNGSKKNRIHYFEPLMPSGVKADEIIREHERQIQQALRRARSYSTWKTEKNNGEGDQSEALLHTGETCQGLSLKSSASTSELSSEGT
ncbi:hypothetical protein BS78_08G124900 [Paspalum vaginatum]|nr:hypothetical protein BS78_08G124900 [Paspalum vaginatum]